MGINMSKSMVDTGEIDAIAWLLTTTPPQYPATFFKKAGQMTGFDSIGPPQGFGIPYALPYSSYNLTSHPRSPQT